jgi:4-oxalocrotonate tautomerase
LSPFRLQRKDPARAGRLSQPRKRLRSSPGPVSFCSNVLHKPLASTFVVIEEVEVENWGWGGLPVTKFRKKQLPR